MVKKERWWSAFQQHSHPAYVTLVEPDGLRGLDLKQERCQLQRILIDDLMDPHHGQESKDSHVPRTFEIQEGTFLLVLPEDADKPEKAIVSQPWLVRVNGIVFKPQKQPGVASYKGTKGTTAAIRKWEKQQLAQGRLAATHFELEVTFFYRVSDLDDVIHDGIAGDRSTRSNLKKLCQALTTLGIAGSRTAAENMLQKRKQPGLLSARYVVFSNHEARHTEDEEDEEDEEDVSAAPSPDLPIPLESVMAPAKVLFLRSKAKLPYFHSPVPNAAANAPQLKLQHRLPAEEQAALKDGHMQLAPGFLCNLIYIKSDSGPSHLFGLEEWAEGTAGSNLEGGWVQTSRDQVAQMLEDTSHELTSLKRQLHQQLQQQPQPSNPATGAAAAAAAATTAATRSKDADKVDEEETSKDEDMQDVIEQSSSSESEPEAEPPKQKQQLRRTPRKQQRPHRVQPEAAEQRGRQQQKHLKRRRGSRRSTRDAIDASDADDDGDDIEDVGDGSDDDDAPARPHRKIIHDGSDSDSDSEDPTELTATDDGKGKQQQEPDEEAAGAQAAEAGAVAQQVRRNSRRKSTSKAAILSKLPGAGSK